MYRPQRIRILLFLSSFIAILTAIPVYSSVNGAQKEYPIKARVISFKGNNSWAGVTTVYEPDGSGRYAFETIESEIKLGNCGDLLTQFQHRTLEQMAEDKYISPEMLRHLSEMTKLGIKPNQFTLLTLYSEMPEAEAKQLFGGTIPEGRKQEGSEKGLVKISRGTLYAVRGFDIVSDGIDGHQIRTLKVPWELSPVETLKRNFDRIKVPALYEMGRAFMEKDVLVGDFTLAMHILITALTSEARMLKLDAGKVILTGHSFQGANDKKSGTRARLFAKLFPVKPLTDERMRMIEDEPAKFLSSYMDLPLPTPQEWTELKDLVSFGTLKKASEKFSVEKISSWGEKISEASGRVLSVSQATEFYQDFLANWTHDYVLTVEGREFKSPIRTQNSATVRLYVEYLMLAKKYGLDPRSANFIRVKELLETNNDPVEVDSFNEGYFDDKVFLPFLPIGTKPDGSPDAAPAFWLGNFNPREVPNAHLAYVGGAILAYQQSIRDWLRGLSAEETVFAMEYMSEMRRDLKLAPIASITEFNFFETFPIVTYSTHWLVNDQFKALGGKRVDLIALQIIMPDLEKQKIEIGASFGPAEGYKFDLRAIEELRRRFPNWSYKLEERENAVKTRMLYRTVL